MATHMDILLELYEIQSILSSFPETPEELRVAGTTPDREARRRRLYSLISTYRNIYPSSQVPVSTHSSDNSIVPKNFQHRFPIFKFSGPKESECVVCYGKFQTDQNVRILSCLHKFHVTCIDPWLEKEHRCPVCRYDLTKIVDIRKL